MLSHTKRCELAKLTTKPEKSTDGNFVDPDWKYFGELWYNTDDSNDLLPGTSQLTSSMFIVWTGRHPICNRPTWHRCGTQKFHYFGLRCRRRQKSRASLPAEFLAVCLLCSWNCSKPARKWTSARLRGLLAFMSFVTTNIIRDGAMVIKILTNDTVLLRSVLWVYSTVCQPQWANCKVCNFTCQ